MPIIRGDDGCYIVIKRRCGIEFYDHQNIGYYIDSEMVASDEYDIAIFKFDVTYLECTDAINETKREEIVSKVVELCKKGRIRVRLFEPNSGSPSGN